VDQLSSDLIEEAVLTPVSVNYLNVIPGIKGTMNANLLSETLVVQTGTTCGWNEAGDVTFTVSPLTVQPLKVNQSLCLQTLNEVWISQYLNSGSYNENVPFEASIMDLMTKQVKRHNEDLIWNATSGSNTFSGFRQIITGSTAVYSTSATTAICDITGTSVTDKAANVLNQVDEIINNFDRNIYGRQDLQIFMSQQQFKCYLFALRNFNNFFIDTRADKLNQVVEVFHPQTDIKIIGVPGLNGSDMIVGGPKQYFLFGTDLMSDEDQYRMWWSQDNQEVRVAINWKLGVQVAFPQFIVWNGLD